MAFKICAILLFVTVALGLPNPKLSPKVSEENLETQEGAPSVPLEPANYFPQIPLQYYFIQQPQESEDGKSEGAPMLMSYAINPAFFYQQMAATDGSNGTFPMYYFAPSQMLQQGVGVQEGENSAATNISNLVSDSKDKQ